MLVKDVIAAALTLLDRADLAPYLDGSAPEGEPSETLNTLVHCYNAVEDELARLYFPLTEERQCNLSNGTLYFNTLPHAPVKILALVKGGRKTKFRLYPQYLKGVTGSATLHYCYAPEKKSLADTAEICEPVSVRMMSYGVAAEYCLICGLMESAEMWESKYRDEIAANRRRSGGPLPERRWV